MGSPSRQSSAQVVMSCSSLNLAAGRPQSHVIVYSATSQVVLPCGSCQVRQLGLLPNVVTSGAVVSAFDKCECQNSLAAHRGDAAAGTRLLSSLTGNSRRQLQQQGLQLM